MPPWVSGNASARNGFFVGYPRRRPRLVRAFFCAMPIMPRCRCPLARESVQVAPRASPPSFRLAAAMESSRDGVVAGRPARVSTDGDVRHECRREMKANAWYSTAARIAVLRKHALHRIAGMGQDVGEGFPFELSSVEFDFDRAFVTDCGEFL